MTVLHNALHRVCHGDGSCIESASLSVSNSPRQDLRRAFSIPVRTQTPGHLSRNQTLASLDAAEAS